MIPFDLSFHTKPTLKPAGMAQQQRKSMTGLITLIVVLAAHLIAGNYFYMMMLYCRVIYFTFHTTDRLI